MHTMGKDAETLKELNVGEEHKGKSFRMQKDIERKMMLPLKV